MKISMYTVPELEHFKELCNFTEDELDYFELKAKNVSNSNIAILLGMSDSKVSVVAKSTKDKIRRVRKYDLEKKNKE